MPDIVVVGAGVGGMAAAARLAKLGHRVTVLEAASVAGGGLRRREQLGFGWESGQAAVCLPAVLRDLFRKSGRPIERYLSLELRTPARRHVFYDGSVVDLPTGSRAGQIQALDAGLGADAGLAWSRFVDSQADVWNRFRLTSDGPDGAGAFGPPEATPSPSRGSLDRQLRRGLPDHRLRDLAAFPFTLAGSRLRAVPAYCAAGVYVERSFGVWTVPSGLSGLTEALVTRLAERKVEVRYDCRVTAIVTGADGVCGVELADGSRVDADLVVAAVDPVAVFSAMLEPDGGRGARVFGAAPRAKPPAVVHLGLRGANPPGLPGEVVLHGDPDISVETQGSAPAGHRAWTVRWPAGRGAAPADVLGLLARRGLDVDESEVVCRIDTGPEGTAAGLGEVAQPIVWDSLRAHRRRSSFARPLPGLYVLAAPLAPGATITEVAWTAAHAATAIGKA